MNRLLSSIHKDVILQVRRQFYTISMGLAVMFAVVFSLTLEYDQIEAAIPAAILLMVGGSTLIFAGGMILDEKEKGILTALVLSPLSIDEYLGAKLISLTVLATLEVGVMVGGPLAWFHVRDGASLPDLGILTLGVVGINVMYTLLGIGITVRFRKITDYMVPVVVVALLLQLPIVYFLGVWEAAPLLLIPSSAPIMLIRGAFQDLPPHQWLYAFGYTAILLVVFGGWARRSYRRWIVERMSG